MVKSNVSYSVPRFKHLDMLILEPYTTNGRKLTKLNFSASGIGKFIIIKNDEHLATLFNSHMNLNVQYMHDLDIKSEDRVIFRFDNRDTMDMDMYVGFEVEDLK